MPSTADQIVLQDRRIAYAITDRDLNVIEISGASSAFLNHHGAWLGKRLTELVPELVGNEDALQEIISGEMPRLQLPWVNREAPDGQLSYLMIVLLPYQNEAGRITGLIHMVQDVTEMGQLEQRVMQQRNELRLLQEKLRRQNLELGAANAELRRLDDVKSAFVSIAAHELRTPLASITGYLEMLLDGDAGALNRKQIDYLRTIESSASRLVRITNDLRDIARIETGQIELALQPTNLAALVETVGTEQAPQIDAKSQRLALRAPSRLPQALCDPVRAAQIVGNLLSNASKYAPPGSLIDIGVSEASEPGFLQVSVSDQGAGISEEEQAMLFRPFYRTASAAATGASGTGLGLHIARSLTELHGGRIWVDSTPGQGTTFFVNLPAAAETGPR